MCHNLSLFVDFGPDSFNFNCERIFRKPCCIKISAHLFPKNRSTQFIWFFSNLVGEEGPRIQGVKDSRVCFLKTLSAPLTFFHFLLGLFLVYPIHFFQLNLNPLLIISAFPVHKQNHKICKASFGNFAVVLYISKQSSYDFCQTFNSL